MTEHTTAGQPQWHSTGSTEEHLPAPRVAEAAGWWQRLTVSAALTAPVLAMSAVNALLLKRLRLPAEPTAPQAQTTERADPVP